MDGQRLNQAREQVKTETELSPLRLSTNNINDEARPQFHERHPTYDRVALRSFACAALAGLTQLSKEATNRNTVTLSWRIAEQMYEEEERRELLRSELVISRRSSHRKVCN